MVIKLKKEMSKIVYRGLDKQDTVNNLGKCLYNLYDEILFQKSNT